VTGGAGTQFDTDIPPVLRAGQASTDSRRGLCRESLFLFYYLFDWWLGLVDTVPTGTVSPECCCIHAELVCRTTGLFDATGLSAGKSISEDDVLIFG
jgi:hypothetical protein